MTAKKLAADCLHEAFAGSVHVTRLDDIGKFRADITIRCAQCNLPSGLNLNGATVSIDGVEARMAIAPVGQEKSPIDKMASGFSVKVGAGGH